LVLFRFDLWQDLFLAEKAGENVKKTTKTAINFRTTILQRAFNEFFGFLLNELFFGYESKIFLLGVARHENRMDIKSVVCVNDV
jgi:hypothetical protein